MCLVLVNTYIPPYAVLSYVWGASEYEHNTYTTQSTNLDERTVAQSLLNVHPPQTLKDATSLIPKIGLRYLWVEALCVVQDDASDKTQQVAQLAVICASAEFTMIAATNLSGSDGIANLRARRPQQSRRTVQLADDLHFTSLPSPGYVHSFNNSETGASPWLRYASSLLQARNLLGMLQDFWCEGLALKDADPRPDGDIPVREKRVSTRFGPETLKSLLFHYSCLRFFPHQNESEYVGILASILRCFAHTTGEVFHWGLPCSRFSSALTWARLNLPPIKLSPEGYAMPDPNVEQRRRTLYPLRGTDGNVITHVGIPSWSWLGWRSAFWGLHGGIMEQLYDEPKWYKIGLGGEVLPVSPVPAPDAKNQRTRAPWRESPGRGFPAGLFEPTPQPPAEAAHFVDSGKVGAWVSTSRLRVSGKCDESTTHAQHDKDGKDGGGATTQTQHQLPIPEAALRWAAGRTNEPPYASPNDSSGKAEEYDFIAVAHDNRCGICVRNSVQRARTVRSHVHLLWVEYRRMGNSTGEEQGKNEADEAERKGACCVDEEVWMRARREWRWVQLS